MLALAESACTSRDEAAAFEVLGDAEARVFEAIAARIIPTTDTPGAREAGVIWFFDKAFGSQMAGALAGARKGLADFEAGIPAAFPGAKSFVDLSEADQDAQLAGAERTPFFGLVRFMTLAGFLGRSTHGGNRDDVGWKLIGLEPGHHAWQYPFGHYDAEYAQEASRGE